MSYDGEGAHLATVRAVEGGLTAVPTAGHVHRNDPIPVLHQGFSNRVKVPARALCQMESSARRREGGEARRVRKNNVSVKPLLTWSSW
jgi:hypothetical protein